MINYSSINDAWGKKDIYKNNKDQKIKPDNNSMSNQQVPIPVPIKESNSEKKEIFIESPYFEKFSSCNVMEHITNCPECKEKFKNISKEMFGQTSETITLPGCNIKLSRDSLKVIFGLIIICIILLLISIITEYRTPVSPPAFNKYMYMPYY